MDQERLARAVLQNAESARLLGVDAVPVYRGRNAEADPLAQVREEPPVPVVVVRAAGPVAGAPPCDATVAGTIAAPVFEVAPVPRTREAVQAALDGIRQRYDADCPHQHFVTDHHNIVFGEGDPLARLVFIGEAPGADEDKCGRPFVGRAGQLLSRMIEAMGLSREEVYISNVLKTRPPDNATPTSEEIRICAPYLFQQIAVIQPEVIVTLGLPATRALLGAATVPMSSLRGRWASFQPPPPAQRPIAVMPTYHPAYLLRNYTPESRAKVWSDLQQVMLRLGLKERQPVQPEAGA
jgi:uracil-DNA glycosylase